VIERGCPVPTGTMMGQEGQFVRYRLPAYDGEEDLNAHKGIGDYDASQAKIRTRLCQELNRVLTIEEADPHITSMMYIRQEQYTHIGGVLVELLPTTLPNTAMSFVWGMRQVFFIRFKDVIKSYRLP
jgi:hypothetical protein